MKSFFYIPLSFKNLAAGELIDILPAGEIWSVVIESPNTAKMWAFYIFLITGNYLSAPLKKGGSWIYVDF